MSIFEFLPIHDPFLPRVRLTGYWKTVQRLAARFRKEQPGVKFEERYSRHVPKWKVIMEMDGAPCAIVDVKHPTYPRGTGRGATRKRRRRA